MSEFHLPRSGIELAIDRMHFPRFEDHTDRSGMVFLALCSIRRLLNRIHNAVYASNTERILNLPGPLFPTVSVPTGQNCALSVIQSLKGVLSELSRQLDVWFQLLPDIIKPDLSRTEPRDTQDARLRLRYWSAKHIISRPCLIYAATWNESEEPPKFVYEYAEVCIRSSRNHIETSLHVLDKRTHFSWMTIQA